MFNVKLIIVKSVKSVPTIKGNGRRFTHYLQSINQFGNQSMNRTNARKNENKIETETETEINSSFDAKLTTASAVCASPRSQQQIPRTCTNFPRMCDRCLNSVHLGHDKINRHFVESYTLWTSASIQIDPFYFQRTLQRFCAFHLCNCGVEMCCLLDTLFFHHTEIIRRIASHNHILGYGLHLLEHIFFCCTIHG
jgi:hypothetical protein